MNSEAKILEKLEEIKAEVDYIKERLDDDSILTEDDKIAISEAEKDRAGGKLISHEELKKQLGL